MKTLYLETEYGVGIDDLHFVSESNEYYMPSAHQIMRLSHNQQGDLVLHHTSYSAHINNMYDENKFQLFKEKLSHYDPKSSHTQKETVEAFSRVMDDLNPDCRAGFKLGVGHTAITADITLPIDKPACIDYRLTTGIMMDHFTPEQAEKYAKSDQSNLLLVLKEVMKQRSIVKKNMGFKEISSEITNLLNKDVLDHMIFYDVGGIYRTNRKDNSKRQAKRETVLYGSTLNLTQDIALDGERLNRAVISFAANRKAVQSINGIALSQHIFDGTSKFSNDFLISIAGYKTLTGNFDMMSSQFMNRGVHL